MLEVEQKFHVPKVDDLLGRLSSHNFAQRRIETHVDTYLRHPGRDFAISGEALRIRQLDDEAFVTYKGPRLAGLVKIRPEIELPIAGEIESWIELWKHLGFTIAQRVFKQRRVMTSVEFPEVTVAVDRVERLGDFAEIEVLIADQAIQNEAVSKIHQVANLLELTDHEPRSYLRQILELDGEK
jgi:adenylate cyclase, class 2